MLKSIFDTLIQYYLEPLELFLEEKEPEKYFSYKSFRIRGFRGLEDVSLNFSKNDLMLLLGLNESGKTSILRAIEAFDFNNDPARDQLKTFFTSMRNKQDIECSQPCVITAEIKFSQPLEGSFFRKVMKSSSILQDRKVEIERFIQSINQSRSIAISRVVPFSNGNPGQSYYQFEGVLPFSSPRVGRLLAQEVIRRCPFILYFEDFQDLIPDRIFTQKRSDAYNAAWYEIIDGLFYNTDKSYSIKKYEAYFSKSNPREDDARSVLKKVNKTLQKTFTEKWENLSGVQEIEESEIAYNEARKYFEIKITERDGTTYSVHERSKGAVWYLAFLMKTEFRRKKLREGSGKPIYLIDEPASNLHSTAQQKMVEDFATLVEDTTLIYTTHSRYLISPSNVKNTYVVQREQGVVTCTRWPEYIHGKDAKISYYQPLYDCLNIVPSNFEIPWKKAIITEGPSDALALELMQAVLDEDITHAIYPGTTASDLSSLISLNIGWGADFKVLFDSDFEGRKQRDRYQNEFGLAEDSFVLLPGNDTEIEDMFSEEELIALNEIAFGDVVTKVSKKQFLALMRALLMKPRASARKVRKVLGQSTKDEFRRLLGALKTA